MNAPNALQRASENFRRFRAATIVCFAAAIVLLLVAASRGNPYSDFTQSTASLGVSFWLTGFGLTFVVVYLRGRIRMIESR